MPLHLDLAGYTIVPVGYGYFRSDEKFGPVRIGRNADELMFLLCFLSHDPTAFTSYRCRYLLAIRNERGRYGPNVTFRGVGRRIGGTVPQLRDVRRRTSSH